MTTDHGEGFVTSDSFTDEDSDTTYTPFIDTVRGCVGYVCKRPNDPPRFITLNASGGSDDGVANVFVYIDDNAPHLVGAVHHYNIWED